ncbi:hypothetical protein SLEP1_g47373 [Rubroshorea leprosula]|uniref:Secreted protein n=1 Tax=Rubroshorea leprosula TaxID=152421 RepID=A0AAV5LT12_9ROSI|nr:hypothetical protein SLEP1_g47373 [Rubroshorea leprosula]
MRVLLRTDSASRMASLAVILGGSGAVAWNGEGAKGGYSRCRAMVDDRCGLSGKKAVGGGRWLLMGAS